MKGAALVKEHIFGPTCTICGIQTGHTEAGVKTVLPSTAMARLDFRLVPDLTPEIVLELLREHLDVRGFKDIEIIELGSAPLAKSSASSIVARAVIGVGCEVYGVAPLVYPMDPSSGPVGAVCGASSPADASGFVWHQLCRFESAWPRRKHSGWMIFSRASSLSGG